MARRRFVRATGAACAVAALLALASCGGGRSYYSATASPTALPATAIATPSPEGDAGAGVRPTPTVKPRCPDPYPDGAPFEAEPGKPLRIRPSVRPPELAEYHPIPFRTDAALRRIVQRAIGEEREDEIAVFVKDLDDGRGVAISADRLYYAASLFKPWMMLEAFHQRKEGLLDFDERYIVSDYYASWGLNPGELAACAEITVGEALERMMSVSDNVAAALLQDRVGVSNVNVGLLNLGLAKSGFHQDGSLPVTAADMGYLLEAIAREGAVDEEASQGMLELLESETIDNRIPARLPKNTRVAHKTGSWSNATHDAGIVYSPEAAYVIVVLTSYGFEDRGAEQIARISRAVYDYYNP